MGYGLAMIAPELSDDFQAIDAGEDGDDREGEDGGQGGGFVPWGSVNRERLRVLRQGTTA